MTPIEKNVIVVDEQGNEYEATYPKRAKGLVKNGRARFITQNKICLLCPPEIEMEDNKMSENINVNENVEEITDVSVEPQKLTINYVLEQIEKIQNQTEHICMSIATLGNLVISVDGPDTSERADSIATVVKCRETTNQKLIALYEKMYDDLKPSKPVDTERIAVLSTLVQTLGEGMTPNECKSALTEILGTALQDFSKNI